MTLFASLWKAGALDPTGSGRNRNARLIYFRRFGVVYLNDGTGNPCAGQSNTDEPPAARRNELTRSSLENFGPFAPMGSGNVTITRRSLRREFSLDKKGRKRGRGSAEWRLGGAHRWKIKLRRIDKEETVGDSST